MYFLLLKQLRKFCCFSSITAPEIPQSSLKLGESNYVVSGKQFGGHFLLVSSLAILPVYLCEIIAFKLRNQKSGRVNCYLIMSCFYFALYDACIGAGLVRWQAKHSIKTLFTKILGMSMYSSCIIKILALSTKKGLLYLFQIILGWRT